MRNWLPGVPALPSSHDGGSMTGSDPYWVWHSYEAPYQLTALNAARSLIRAGNEVHFTFHPLTGDIVQILPANRAGRGLVNKPGGVQTNRQGKCCIQVEVIAYAKRPWTRDLTAAGRKGLAKLMAYATELGVPAGWPAGPPPAYPNGSDPRSARVWNASGGHFSHSQIPENTHGDPGAIDVKALFDAYRTPQQEDDMPDAADIGREVAKALMSAAVGSGDDSPGNLGTALYRTQSELMRVADQIANAAELDYAIARGDKAAQDKAIARVRQRDIQHPGEPA